MTIPERQFVGTEAPAPYGTYTDRAGWEWHVDTDGNGGLVERRVRYVGLSEFERGIKAERSELRSIMASKMNGDASAEEVRDVLLSVLRNASGPMSTREVSKAAGLWLHQAETALQRLRREGKIKRSKSSRRGLTATVWAACSGNGAGP